MIFHWFVVVIRILLKLVIPPPAGSRVKRDPKLRCPVCGSHKEGRLRCVAKEIEGQEESGAAKVGIFCEHTCAVCGARYCEKPIANVTPKIVQPAIPRNDIEKAEDADDALRATRPAPSPAPGIVL
jgi:hypothetical protein